MLALALIIGAYSYSILLLGLFHLLNYNFVFLVSIFFAYLVYKLSSKYILEKLLFLKKQLVTFTKKEISLIFLLFLIAIVNLIGALGPELAFDALWYHLTIPKLFVEAQSVYFIRGELLYYSLWPKLTEMLYAASMIFGNEILAKLIHFTFGILTTVVVYKISRLYISRFYSITASLIFYSNLVVAWLSITAFVDLTRSFYETLALLYFLMYRKDLKKINFIFSAILLGLAISTKLLSIGSILIFIALIILTKRTGFRDKFKDCILYLFITLLFPLPYFLISFYYTGNPFYPLFTKLTSSYFSLNLLDPLNFIKSLINVFLLSADPINPIYFILLPLIILSYKRFQSKVKDILIYSITSLVVFYLIPQTGGGRFITAYLPALSVLSAVYIACASKRLQKILLLVIMLIAFITIFYRFAANMKFLPVVLGVQTKNDFLMNNLNFPFGDFYDENGEIKKIVKNNKVMVLGIHNLYYIDFPLTIPEWGGAGSEKYTLIYSLSEIKNVKKKRILYKNSVTHVTLYQNYD